MLVARSNQSGSAWSIRLVLADFSASLLGFITRKGAMSLRAAPKMTSRAGRPASAAAIRALRNCRQQAQIRCHSHDQATRLPSKLQVSSETLMLRVISRPQKCAAMELSSRHHTDLQALQETSMDGLSSWSTPPAFSVCHLQQSARLQPEGWQGHLPHTRIRMSP